MERSDIRELRWCVARSRIGCEGNGLPVNVWLVLLIVLAATAWLRATTRYIVERDRLIIRRVGLEWMQIPFQDVEDIEHRLLFFDKILQIRMYQLRFPQIGGPRSARPIPHSRDVLNPGEALRIRKKGYLRYVLINPVDPMPLLNAFTKCKTNAPRQADTLESPGLQLPDWLRRN